MRKYQHKIAAELAVRANTQHGLSRHRNPVETKGKVSSVLTEVAHVSALAVYAKWLLKLNGRHLKNSKLQDAKAYLSEIASTKKQSTVSLARQAINMHIHPTTPLVFVTSQVPTIPKNRAYSRKQIDLLCACADPLLRFSILLAADAGLREMELMSIAPKCALSSSARNWSNDRFRGRHGDQGYVVHGKGGLLREVYVSHGLAIELDSHLRPEMLRVRHRGAHLNSYFDLMGGHEFAIKFGRLSKKILGFSNGAHGLRHSFAQNRRDQLICCGFSIEEAIQILSQELGHFSTKNTLAYLRDRRESHDCVLPQMLDHTVLKKSSDHAHGIRIT